MKKVVINIISIIAIFIILVDPEEIKIKIVALKFLSLGWLWLVAKSNNYFYQGGIKNEKN